MNTETRQCQNCKNPFMIEPEDFAFYEKIKVPAPTWCPECRAVRRLIFWNERNLFRKKDAKTGKEIFSGYPEEAGIPVYDHDFWWSDAWNPMDYGRDYDFSRPFFEQFHELMWKVPWCSRSVQGLVGSDYCNQASFLKNCYLCFNGQTAEECFYGVAFGYMRDSLDFYQCKGDEFCYEVFSVGSSYQTFFSWECKNARNVWFSRNCLNCENCFGCVNLRHKSYHFFNQPYSKEDYERKIRESNLGSYRSLLMVQDQVWKFWLQFPRRYQAGIHNVDVIAAEYVYDSRNVRYTYQGLELENVRYSQSLGTHVKDSYDYTNWGDNSELIYESVVCGRNCRNLKFCFDCWPACQDMEYSINCHSSHHLFGCVGLKKRSTVFSINSIRERNMKYLFPRFVNT